MKIQNLGKIVLLFLMSITVFAKVQIELITPAIYKGDEASFKISAFGEEVKFPNIDMIDSFNILGTSSSQEVSSINGNVTRKISKIYTFAPTRSVVLPSFKIEVDGKVYKTEQKNIKVVKPSASKSTDEALILLKANKTEVRVGQSIDLSIIIKEKLNANIYKINAYEPKLDNFWLRRVSDEEDTIEGDYKVKRIKFIAFPQKAGEYNIPPIKAQIGKMRKLENDFFNDPFFDVFSNRVKWKNIYSNDLKLKVNPLPNNLEVFGTYTISASVDKYKVKANEPVNLTLVIKGLGNIDDIKKFNLDIPNAVIYEDEPKIETNLQEDKYAGVFTQKIAIVAQNDYTILPIKFTYFDEKTEKIKTISTEKIDIKVKGLALEKTTPKLQSAIPTLKEEKSKQKVKTIIKEEESFIKYLTLVLGIIIGLIAFALFNKIKNKKQKKQNDMTIAIKKAKNDKQLFEILLPYSKKDKQISNILGKLEENIYQKSNHKINKNILIDIFDDIKIV